MNEYVVKPIGHIRSEHQIPEHTPIQPIFCTECRGRIELFPEYAEGLKDIEGFSHIYLLYWLHRASPARMTATPFLEDKEHGIFAIRAPSRPNPIGLSIVRLIEKKGATLHIGGVDILDMTPLLDIKPYMRSVDCFPDARNGWQEKIDAATAQKRGRRGYMKAKPAGRQP
ncbi:MAG: tRNA (N6-threonylcarbamoyladenosine(37)-N6)-methyltransferase TrmO [Chitinispirillaceae bacterium]|nr:tRNA (N6-threonylcarbamoyladenosine(37)-N6)-methyltransferase TrmO [Chitinispirillaceae bacterium]